VGAAGTGKSTALNHILHAELSRTVSFYFLSKLCS
jgi:GTPase Era involved in 16S rRNA processing